MKNHDKIWRFVTGHYLTESFTESEFEKLKMTQIDWFIIDVFDYSDPSSISDMIREMVEDIKKLCEAEK